MEEKDFVVTSREYWNRRFDSGDWETNQGAQQTRYFYSLLVTLLPDWLKDRIRSENLSITDFGCAEGQGIPILNAELGGHITGVDISDIAIETAKAIYEQFHFEIGDVWQYSQETDVAVLSNIAEHFPDPYELLRKISKIVKKYIIVMVPLEENNLMAEHCFTFRYQNIPVQIEDFQLIHFAEHDCRKDSEQLFFAKQVLIVYAKEKSTRKDLKIAQMDGLLGSMQAEQIKEHKIPTELLRNIETGQAKACELSELVLKHTTAIHEEAGQQDKATWEHIEKQTKKILKANQINMHHQAKVAYDTVDRVLKAVELRQKNDQLTKAIQETDRKYAELVSQFNNLNDVYGYTVAENVQIKQSRTFRAAELQKKLLQKLHLVGLLKFLLCVLRHGPKEAMRQWKERKQAVRVAKDQQLLLVADSVQSEALSPDEQWREAHRKICQARIQEEWTEVTKRAAAVIDGGSYKGIVVYPLAVHWEPVQRPQHLLRCFARNGYLCFFCEPSTERKTIDQIEENLYIIYGEEYLLPALQNKYPIVLVTYHNQSVFCDMLPQKYLWFDVLDNLDFFDRGNEKSAQEIYQRLQRRAQLVTYSADNLKQFITSRKDALKLNNAVCIEDFLKYGTLEKIDELEQVKARGKKIVGYYGAIEEWFDQEAIKVILEKTDFEVVLIGRCGIDLSGLKDDRLHIIGAVPYTALRSYTRYFDVAMIPFRVNDLTNSVSPVKFFEYAAQEKPILSSDIHEMRAYQCNMVQIYHDYEELVGKLYQLLKQVDRTELRQIASENTWEIRATAVLERINQSPQGLCTLSDFTSSGMVSVESVTFFKYDGTTYYSGGAERYLLDLDEICREMGIYFRIYQYASYPWVRFYNNTEVVGLAAEKNDVNEYNVQLIEEMASKFARETRLRGAVNIYSPFYIIDEKDTIPSIGISHGISWDSEWNHFTDGSTFWQINKNIIDAAELCGHMISVDTNTCNWFQTLDYNIGRKLCYVPNYVNNQEFCPRENFEQLRDPIIITYPRRLYGARGLYIALEILDDVLTKYPNVEFHFVGKGFENDIKHVQKKVNQWNGRVKMYSRPPNEMCEVYQQTDITLIPTMYSEGTSLSCLEALSSGNAVICTRIGGLTDLILDGYNGLLVEPNGEALKQAVFSLLDHPEKIAELKRNAILTAQAFSKEKWKAQWKQTILESIGDRPVKQYEDSKRCWIELSNVDHIKRLEVLKAIRKYLEDHYYVYVACNRNPFKMSSYKRLQFVDANEDIYFEPEVWIRSDDLFHLEGDSACS